MSISKGLKLYHRKCLSSDFFRDGSSILHALAVLFAFVLIAKFADVYNERHKSYTGSYIDLTSRAIMLITMYLAEFAAIRCYEHPVHFWHCAQSCQGDADNLKNMWIGVIHHVCGEHEWEDGQCSHGPMTNSTEETKRILAKNSKAAEELRKIVFDCTWLKSLQFYVNFRHTSNLENFNSMLLKYAPKRIGFSYEVFKARVLLAALDHNFHLFREVVPGRFKKVYSKRSKNWHVEPVKVDKQYKYWPVLLADILNRRLDDEAAISRHVVVSPTHPSNLAPTIALRQPPPTSQLVNQRLSRFKK